nr:response regulator [Pelagibacterium luteolum]
MIVFHVEQMVEDLGHIFVGSADSFTQLQDIFKDLEVDGVLVDIDLKDGPTGPQAAAWLKERGIDSVFVTGQEQVAAAHGNVSLATLGKPVLEAQLGEKLELFRT